MLYHGLALAFRNVSSIAQLSSKSSLFLASPKRPVRFSTRIQTMSARQAKVLQGSLLWSEYLLVLSFLSLTDLYRGLGQTCKDAFVAYLREKAARRGDRGVPGVARFLPRDSRCHKVLQASYPRSGNSYLRKLLELHTGIITGSDSRTNRVLSSALLECGFKGEGDVLASMPVAMMTHDLRLYRDC